MKEKVLEILAAIDSDMKDGINLIDEGLLDSFQIANVVMELEEALDIQIAVGEVVAENFETVDAIVALVEKSM